MRLYEKSVIYWRSTPRENLPASVPWHMIPLRPRHHRQLQAGEVERSYTGGGGKERTDYEVCMGVVTRGIRNRGWPRVVEILFGVKAGGWRKDDVGKGEPQHFQ